MRAWCEVPVSDGPSSFMHDVRKVGRELRCIRCDKPLAHEMLRTACVGRSNTR